MTIKNALKLVLSQRKYLIMAIAVTLIVGILFHIIGGSISMIITNNGLAFTIISLSISYLLAILVGISAAFVWYQIDFKKKFDVKGGSASIGSLFLGLLTSGCPVCGTIITTVLGIGSGLASLPLKGIELKLLSLGLLSITLVFSSKHIVKRHCEHCK